MITGNRECQLDLTLCSDRMALLERAGSARTILGTIETEAECAKLHETRACPEARADHGVADGRPNARAEDSTLITLARPWSEHAHGPRQATTRGGALQERVELQSLTQRHSGAQQKRAARGIGVLPDGRVVGRVGNFGRELTRVLETAVRVIELQRDEVAGCVGRGNRRIPGRLHGAERADGELNAEWRRGRTRRFRDQLDRAAERAGAQ